MDRSELTDESVILEMDNRFILLEYFVYSDITIKAGSKNEILQQERADIIMSRRDNINNYFEYDDSVKKDDIEGRKVNTITVERFSHAFEYNIQGDERPEGGDYFSTIRLHLDNGVVLCFCGADAIADGYVYFWCEK